MEHAGIMVDRNLLSIVVDLNHAGFCRYASKNDLHIATTFVMWLVINAVLNIVFFLPGFEAFPKKVHTIEILGIGFDCGSTTDIVHMFISHYPFI